MQLRLLPLLLLAANPPATNAATNGIPSGVCAQRNCTPAQARIWKSFQAAQAPDFGPAPQVYSGHCCMDGRGFDPRAVHFGAVLIDSIDGALLFNGRFSFFTKRNPYTHLNVVAARARFTSRSAPAMKLKLRPSHAFTESVSTMQPFRYWLRQPSGGNNLLMVGYFGFVHTILCDLHRNPG